MKLHYTSWDDADAVDERDISRTYHPTTGRIGATWDINPQVMVYAQYATAANPASGNLASAYFSTLSDNTKLTTGRQLEIGSKVGFLDGRGNATVALFDIERKNIATSDPQKPRERLLIGKQHVIYIITFTSEKSAMVFILYKDITRIDFRFLSFIV